ncbi:MAG: hypothetical protein GY870_20065, partial [archaeon]|nr:hypothetical protein [archaeon]
INNENPNPEFSIHLIEGKQYNNTLDINITIPLDENATLHDINFLRYFYNVSNNPNEEVLIGDATNINGVWNYQWDISGPSWTENITTIKAQVIDEVGWETNISINIIVDNVAPSPIIISPNDNSIVGKNIDILVQCDVDTIEVELWNCTTEFGTFTYYSQESTYLEGQNHRNFSLQFNTETLAPGSSHYLIIKANDSIFINSSSILSIVISDIAPSKITTFDASETSPLYDPATRTYNISLEWRSPLTGYANITEYRIFRVSYESNVVFKTAIIDLMTDEEKEQYLGNSVGEKYCIAIIEVEEIDDGIPREYNWTDTGLYAADYYYLVLAINSIDYSSPCSDILLVSIEEEVPPNKFEDLSIVQILFLLFGLFTSVLLIYSVVTIKSTRAKWLKRRTEEAFEKIDDSKFTQEGEKTLEDRLEEMETFADITLEEETGILMQEEVEKSGGQISEDEKFLGMKITEEKDTTPEVDDIGGPRRCPYCNWIISSQIVKCPRCGKLVKGGSI